MLSQTHTHDSKVVHTMKVLRKTIIQYLNIPSCMCLCFCVRVCLFTQYARGVATYEVIINRCIDRQIGGSKQQTNAECAARTGTQCTCEIARPWIRNIQKAYREGSWFNQPMHNGTPHIQCQYYPKVFIYFLTSKSESGV